MILVGKLQKIGKLMGNSLHAISKNVGYLVASHQKEATIDQCIEIIRLMDKRSDEFKRLSRS